MWPGAHLDEDPYVPLWARRERRTVPVVYHLMRGVDAGLRLVSALEPRLIKTMTNRIEGRRVVHFRGLATRIIPSEEDTVLHSESVTIREEARQNPLKFRSPEKTRDPQ